MAPCPRPISRSINFPLLPSPGDSRAGRRLGPEHPLSQSPAWRRGPRSSLAPGGTVSPPPQPWPRPSAQSAPPGPAPCRGLRTDRQAGIGAQGPALRPFSSGAFPVPPSPAVRLPTPRTCPRWHCRCHTDPAVAFGPRRPLTLMLFHCSPGPLGPEACASVRVGCAQPWGRCGQWEVGSASCFPPGSQTGVLSLVSDPPGGWVGNRELGPSIFLTSAAAPASKGGLGGGPSPPPRTPGKAGPGRPRSGRSGSRRLSPVLVVASAEGGGPQVER